MKFLQSDTGLENCSAKKENNCIKIGLKKGKEICYIIMKLNLR